MGLFGVYLRRMAPKATCRFMSGSSLPRVPRYYGQCCAARCCRWLLRCLFWRSPSGGRCGEDLLRYGNLVRLWLTVNHRPFIRKGHAETSAARSILMLSSLPAGSARQPSRLLDPVHHLPGDQRDDEIDDRHHAEGFKVRNVFSLISRAVAVSSTSPIVSARVSWTSLTA